MRQNTHYPLPIMNYEFPPYFFHTAAVQLNQLLRWVSKHVPEATVTKLSSKVQPVKLTVPPTARKLGYMLVGFWSQ